MLNETIIEDEHTSSNHRDIQDTLNKYQEILKQGKKSNYRKFFWTFWFLVHSVVFHFYNSFIHIL